MKTISTSFHCTICRCLCWSGININSETWNRAKMKHSVEFLWNKWSKLIKTYCNVSLYINHVRINLDAFDSRRKKAENKLLLVYTSYNYYTVHVILFFSVLIYITSSRGIRVKLKGYVIDFAINCCLLARMFTLHNDSIMHSNTIPI